MAESTSPFSFHCMICYEEFDTKRRYPVVLPCGHTYVCTECANRIDRCIECRTSVFEELPTPPSDKIIIPNQSMGSRPISETIRSRRTKNNRRFATSTHNARRHTTSANHTRRHATPTNDNTQNATKTERVPRKRLPLPKNVVLMSLMKSTELESKSAEDHQNLIEINVDEHDTEEDKIKESTEIATGACGTYAVASKHGLEIVPNIPTKKAHMKTDSKSSDWESRMNQIIRQNSGPGASSRDKESNFRKHFRLNYGDRVQVVTIIDGWAKLARGYGFVHCKVSSDLVKVGGALDKACNLEAMILARSLRRGELLKQQARVERDAREIMNEMQKTLTKTEDLTVIAAEAFSTKEPALEAHDCRDDDDIQPQNTNATQSEDEVKKSTVYVVQNESRDNSTGLLCFPIELLSFFNFNNEGSSKNREKRKLFSSSSTVRQSDMVAGAQKWRQKHGKEAVSGTDFKTGISCHYGVHSSTYVHPHHFLDKELAEHAELPKMSQHSGLSSVHSRRKFLSSFSFG